MRNFLPSLLLWTLSAAALGAHPHIFVETALVLRTDDKGAISGIEISWEYDQLYSLLVLEDMALDQDYDGVLTEAEQATLDGFDMNWVEGFNGDIEVQAQGAPVVLDGPKGLGTGFADEKITSRHLRRFAQPVHQVTIQVYDPSFYTAYDLNGGISLPPHCRFDRKLPDLDAAYARVEAILTAEGYSDEDFPAVGEIFAEELMVTCDILS